LVRPVGGLAVELEIQQLAQSLLGGQGQIQDLVKHLFRAKQEHDIGSLWRMLAQHTGNGGAQRLGGLAQIDARNLLRHTVNCSGDDQFVRSGLETEDAVAAGEATPQHAGHQGAELAQPPGQEPGHYPSCLRYRGSHRGCNSLRSAESG
jgi:hypothetical protein